jgi:hypothetical protein
MSIVVIYRFRATFSVKAGREAAHPDGVVREGMLFLAQDGPARDDAAALAACVPYEITKVAILGFGVLDVAVLGDDAYRDFAPQYEKALRDGSALTHYPTVTSTAPASGVLSSGFSSDLNSGFNSNPSSTTRH